MITENQIELLREQLYRRHGGNKKASPKMIKRYLNLLRLKFATEFVASSAQSDVVLELIRCKREIKEITAYFKDQGFKI